jgi:tetrahydromethanopterin S-methyltransferase subunit G
MRQDAAVATCGIITFGAAAQPIFEQLTPDQQDAAYRAVAERIADECGTSVRGLVVHGDEAAPHAHVTWDARSEDGAAMSKIMQGSRLQDIAAEVMAEHAPGIVRGERKSARIQRGDDAAQVYHRSVAELHRDLPDEIAELRADRDAAAAKLEKNERLAKQAREKAEGNDTRAEKARKRAETYEKRVEDAQAEISRLDARSAALTAHEKRLDLAENQIDAERDELDDERDRLSEIRARVEDLIGSVADRLGVGDDLRAIRDALSGVDDPFQAPDSDGPDIEM